MRVSCLAHVAVSRRLTRRIGEVSEETAVGDVVKFSRRLVTPCAANSRADSSPRRVARQKTCVIRQLIQSWRPAASSASPHASNVEKPYRERERRAKSTRAENSESSHA